MAKFEVCITEGLEGEEAKDWQEHVADYVQQEWDDIQSREEAEAGDTDESVTGHEVESATLLDE